MIRLMRRALRDLGTHRRWLTGVLACTLAYAGARITSPLLARLLLDATVHGRSVNVAGNTLPPATVVLVVPLLIGAIAGTLAGSQYLMRYWGGLLGQHLAADFQVRLFEHLLRLPQPSLERRALGRHTVRFGSDMQAIRRLVARTLPEVVRDIIAVAAIAAALAGVHRPLAIPVVGALAVFVLTILVTGHRLQSASRILRAERSRVAGMAFDRLRAATTVKLAGAERRETMRLQRAQRRVVDAAAQASHLSGLLSGGAEVVVGIAVATALGWGAHLALAGRISAGEMVAFYGLTLLLVSPLRSLSRALESMAPGTVALERMYQVLDGPVEDDRPRARRLRVRAGAVTFAGVETERGRIPDISIGPGFTALTGHTSYGHLGPLLVRLIEPAAGAITIDGTPIARVTRRSLRRAVAYISDPPVLLKGSLRRALRSGLGSVSDDALQAALAAVGAHWADTLDRQVGSGGRRLSPLERWQVLCARALVARPAIVIMDRPPVDGPSLDVVLQAMQRAGVRTIALTGEQTVRSTLAGAPPAGPALTVHA